MRFVFRFFVIMAGIVGFLSQVTAQRVYKSNSVLASGQWYKISVKEAGIYKIDISFLTNLGINATNLSSSSIRLYGNAGRMLSESNNGLWLDDLIENAIFVADGGDGILNGSDYILFYAPGPDKWIKDTINHRFSYQKNLYSDSAYYFITIGGTGKRITISQFNSPPNKTITDFSGRYCHELDTVNFLSSGKEWYGEEFMDAPGKSLTRKFSLNIPGMLTSTPVVLQTNCIARSAGAASRFDIKVNNQPVGQIPVDAVAQGQYAPFAMQAESVVSSNVSQASLDIEYSYLPGSFNAQGWLNRFLVFSRNRISMSGVNQMQFQDWESVGPGNSGEFIIDGADNNTLAWEITDPLNPVLMPGSFTGGQYRFVNDCSSLREYISFKNAGFLTPKSAGRISNQDLHNTTPADMVVIVYPEFIAQANRLAEMHEQKNGLRIKVVTTEQVYYEFASGISDPVAIRDYVKMYYDRYHTDSLNRLKYLLLFGDASFDYKNRIAANTNFVPAYQNNFSLDPLATYTSDDFFGFLDDDEDINSGTVLNLLDIGIGRIPAKSITEAENYVNKVEQYLSPASLGPWRNTLTFIADDEDNNLHFQDAELITAAIPSIFNQQKIYLDAFPQQNSSGGSSYPLANQAINNQVYNGTLIWNYNGHGGDKRLAEETILDQEIINSWDNENRLPLFITATCDFAPYDNPFLSSIGENILLRPKTGAIALMTTTRTVFAFSNRIMNQNYLQFALQPDANNKYRTLGDAVKTAKNYTYQNFGDITNNRKFTLLGDPALTLGFPVYNINTLTINGNPASQADTLMSTDKVIITGEVADGNGSRLTDFNGTVYPIVFEKPQTVSTLGNDPGSQVAQYQIQNTALFRGKTNVTNGSFSFEFVVPKDINFQFGNGKISYYASNGEKDAGGFSTNVIIGGTGQNTSTDNTGPQIKPYLNDETFVNGGISDQRPLLILKLSDSSGINTTGAGIGHDIIVFIDNDNNNYFILNDFYQSDLDTYQKGEVRFQLPEFEPGPHSLKIKAWDAMNNSNEVILDFLVANDEELRLSHVLNYPNPFTTNTRFWFEHNQPGVELSVNIQIFTIGGKLIKTIQKTINTPGNRSSEIEWNGKDDFGDKVGRGVYFYKLSVTSPGRKKKECIEKLVIF